MRKSQFTEEQKIVVAQQASAGTPVRELCRKHGIPETTFYRWRAKYDGLQVSDAKRFRALEDENRRLKFDLGLQKAPAMPDSVLTRADAQPSAEFDRVFERMNARRFGGL